ncbi:MAG: hypothetical protein U9N61_02695 [Euryarchaeota archaeon]|nr:hypothetical protein [Euryarchaeota archaeon]
MALETLRDVDKIGGYGVAHKPTDAGYIDIDYPLNRIAFTIQNSPIKEVGVNGCQVDTIIEAARIIIEKLDEEYPHPENKNVLHHLDFALGALQARTMDRESRGVEGTSQD